MCECVPPPPEFDVGPPPEPAFLWADFEHSPNEAASCDFEFAGSSSSSQPDSSSSPGSGGESSGDSLAVAPFVGGGLVLFLVLLLCTALTLRIRRRTQMDRARKKKTPSADHILTAPDTLWSYNSMKTTTPHSRSHHGSFGVLMYGGGSTAALQKTPTPATIRSFRPDGMRQSSTCVRLHAAPDNYHTVGRHYEEIPSRPSPLVAADFPPVPPRYSLRRPPPTCRPPPPPPSDDYVIPNELARKFHSPGCSDSSMEHELAGLPQESPPVRRSAENGRESGYGTAPSRQWKSPPSAERAPPGLSQTHFPESHSMTYV